MMYESISRRSALASGATALGISVAGCSGGSGESGGPTVGILEDRSGNFQLNGTSKWQATRLALEEINENGGLLGEEIEIVDPDPQSDNSRYQELTERLILQDQVDALWAGYSSATREAIRPIINENEQLYFYTTQYEGGVCDNTIFPVGATARQQLGIVTPYLADEFGEDIYIIAADYNFGQLSGDWVNVLAQENGYNIVQRQKHGVGAKDFSTLISQAQSAGAEVLLDTPVPPGGITAMKQINESNWSPKFIQLTRAADTSSWWSALGEAGEYVCMAPGWVPGLTGNGNAQMAQAYRDTYDIASDDLLPVIVGAAYNITQVTEQAVNAASGTDRASVRDAIRNNEYQTVIGEFGFDDVGRPTGLDAPMGQWVDGDQHLVYPQTDSEAFHELTYPIPE